MPLTDEGFTALRTADYLTIIRDDYETRTGLVVDWKRDVFLGVITAIQATQLGDISEAAQSIYDARSPNNAQGIQQSDLATGVGVTRRESTFSTATVTITGTSGTVILTGRQVRGGGNLGDAIWETQEDVTIGGGGTVEVVVEAVDAGEVLALIGEINEIATPVSGWTSVVNAAAADPGDDTENDSTLRIRRQQSLQISGAGSPAAIRSNLLALQIDDDAVLSTAIVLENDRITPITVEGVTISGHALHVIVAPDTLTTAEKEAVAEVIYDLKASAVDTDGAVAVTVQGEDLLDKTIRFDFVTDVATATAIVVTMETQQPAGPIIPTFAQVKPLIEAAVTAHYLALTPGDDVLNIQVLALVGAIDGIRTATVSFNIGGGPIADVDINLDQLAIESPAAVVTEAP